MVIEFMSNTQQSIGVFPLPVCILPGGITQLRIFEPRYIRLVSEAAQRGGFVMSVFDKSLDFESSTYGTLVEIIDFEQRADGLLGIKVRGISLVSLSEFSQDDDKLHRASMNEIEHWSGAVLAENAAVQQQETTQLASMLEKLITNNSELASYYTSTHYHSAEWVCARYIELLPLSPSKKQQLIFEQTFEQCQNFLHTIIKGEQPLN